MLSSEEARQKIRLRWDRPDNIEKRVAAAERHIRHLVATAPPLTAEQAERLRALLPDVAEG